MRTTLFMSLAVLAGAVAGLGSGAWFMHKYSPKETRVDVATVSEGRATRESLATLANVLAETKNVAVTVTQDPLNEGAQARAKRPVLSPEERRERWRERYVQRWQRIKNEPRDPAWAEPTERLFRQDFAQRAEKFEADVVGMECKTTGCLVQVRWNSYSKARAKFRDIVHESFSTNCATTMEIGSAPPNADAPHDALVIFECEQARIEAFGAPTGLSQQAAK